MKNIFKSYSSIIISFVVTFIITTSISWFFANRIGYIRHMKPQINTIISDLNELGYDISYDDFSVSYLPFTNSIKFENFKIYNLYIGENFEYNLGNISILTPFMNHNEIEISFDKNLYLQTDDDNLDINLKKVSMYSQYENNKIDKISFTAKDLLIDKILNIENMNVDFSRSDDGQNLAKIDMIVDNIKIDDSINFPLMRNISKISLNLLIPNNFQLRSENSKINIDKAILRWEPLLLVGKGNIHTNSDGLDIRLNTTSKGLFETLEMVNQAKMLDEESFEVLKIMIETESYKINPDDKYKTTTTSIRFRNSQISINSVPICTLPE